MMSIQTALGLWSYNVFLLIGFVNLCFYIKYADNPQRLKTLFAYGVAGLLYLPIFINFTLKQLSTVTETYLDFHPIVFLFTICTNLFVGERSPTSNNIVDAVVRNTMGIAFTAFFVVTGILCLRSLRISSQKVRVLWYWAVVLLLLVYIYSMKTVITSARYVLFLAPVICLLVADLYEKRPRYVFILAFLSFFLCLYELNVAYVYRGDSKGILESIEYDNQSLIICSDGVAYHTAKFYSKDPMFVYDPERKLPFYMGTAIF